MSKIGENTMIFRGFNSESNSWKYGYHKQIGNNHYILEVNKLDGCHHFIVIGMSIGFSDGVFDVDGNPIFASIKIDGKLTLGGDSVLIRTPEIDTQTHTGDNIINGSYTEPIGVYIKEYEGNVIFENGVICCSDECSPLYWNNNTWTKESIINTISYVSMPWESESNYPNEIEDDLNYLIEECAKVKTIDELIQYLSGIRVTSKQWDLEENRAVIAMLILSEVFENYRVKTGENPSSIEMSEDTINWLIIYSILQGKTEQVKGDSYFKGILIKLNNNLKFNQFKVNGKEN